jgi:nucleotide-binding universal stress UspA family protein
MTTTAPDHRIVVGVDGSQPSRPALSWAAEEAVRRRLPLHLLHSYQVLTPYAGGDNHTDLTDVDTERIRSAAHQVVDEAPLTSAVLGSVSTQVAMHALAPVVVLKDPEHPDRPRDSVVVGTDGSAGSLPALGYAFEQAGSRGTSLEALYTWSADSAGWIPGASLVTATHRMETRGHLLLAEAVAGLVLGSVSHGVLQEAGCPVAVVRGETGG